MTGEAESATPQEIAIMVVTTAIQFACGFGLVALIAFGIWEVAQGTLTVPQLIGFPLCFGLTLATGMKAMMLVCRPTLSGMVGLLLMSASSIAVAVAIVI